MTQTIAPPDNAAKPDELADLADLSPRHAKWDKRKADSLTAAAIIKQRHPKKAAKIDACCDQIALQWHEDPTGERFGKVTGTHRCRNPKVCDVCATTKANQWRRELGEALPRIVKDYPAFRFVFLTLTVRNCPSSELRATLKAMSAAWFKLIRRREVATILKGFLRGTEVTRGEDGSAHPHFHALLIVPAHYFSGQSYINQKRWRQLWQESARLDYDPSVNVKAAKKGAEMFEDVIKIAAYSVKKSEAVADPEWFNDYHDQTLGFRFTNTGGLFRDYLKDEPATTVPDDEDGAETEAPKEAKALDEIDVFKYERPRKRYRKIRSIARPVEPNSSA